MEGAVRREADRIGGNAVRNSGPNLRNKGMDEMIARSGTSDYADTHGKEKKLEEIKQPT